MIYLPVTRMRTRRIGTCIATLRLPLGLPLTCVKDVKAGMKYLQDMCGLENFVLLSRSFGGACVHRGAEDKIVVAHAAIASQTTGRRESGGWHCAFARDWGQYAQRLVLKRLYEIYGGREIDSYSCSKWTIMRFSRNARKAKDVHVVRVYRPLRWHGVDGQERDMVSQDLVDDGERIELMKKEAYLREPESVQ